MLIDDVNAPSGVERATGNPAWSALIDGKPSWVVVNPHPRPHVVGMSRMPVDRKRRLSGADSDDEDDRKAKRKARRAARAAAFKSWKSKRKSARAKRTKRRAIRATRKTGKYRDYTFDDQRGKYVYRQFKDGRVYVLESPRRSYYPDGLRVKNGTKAYRAIRVAIAAHNAKKRDATVLALVRTANAAAGLVPAATDEVDVSTAPSYEDDAPSLTTALTTSTTSEFPWGLAAAGAVGIVALLGFALTR